MDVDSPTPGHGLNCEMMSNNWRTVDEKCTCRKCNKHVYELAILGEQTTRPTQYQHWQIERQQKGENERVSHALYAHLYTCTPNLVVFFAITFVYKCIFVVRNQTPCVHVYMCTRETMCSLPHCSAN